MCADLWKSFGMYSTCSSFFIFPAWFYLHCLDDYRFLNFNLTSYWWLSQILLIFFLFRSVWYASPSFTAREGQNISCQDGAISSEVRPTRRICTLSPSHRGEPNDERWSYKAGWCYQDATIMVLDINTNVGTGNYQWWNNLIYDRTFQFVTWLNWSDWSNAALKPTIPFNGNDLMTLPGSKW